jgi:hypothetical protein
MIDCDGVIPCVGGFQNAPHPLSSSTSAPSAVGYGVAYPTDAEQKRIFASAGLRLYKTDYSTWTDVGRVANYGATGPWSFAQYGDVILASNRIDPIQAFTGATFADIAASPKARIVFAVGDFVMALNTNDGTYGDQPDAWWCCGIFDYTTWAPSVSTQANRGQLRDVGGPLTAGLALGRQAVAYKRKALWLGSYVGGAAVWQWDRVPGNQGALQPEAVCEYNQAHYFMGPDGFYRFDGARVDLIGLDIWAWVKKNYSVCFDGDGLQVSSSSRHCAVSDRAEERIWFFIDTSVGFSGLTDMIAMVYHPSSGTWGKVKFTGAERPFKVFSDVRYDGLSAYTGIVMSLPNSASPNTLHIPRSLIQDREFSTALIGDAQRATALTEVRLGIIQNSAAADASYAYARTYPYAGTNIAANTTPQAPLRNGGYHLRTTGRWHKVTVSPPRDSKFDSIGVEFKAAGSR